MIDCKNRILLVLCTISDLCRVVKDNCGCGKCDFMKLIKDGCSNPRRNQFLYLDTSTLDPLDKSTLILKVDEDGKAINEAYRHVVYEFNNWMEKYVPVEVCRTILVNIPGTRMNNIPFLKDRWAEIEKADYAKCFVLLSDYHTWFNCSVLEQVLKDAKHVTKNDPIEVISKLQSYTEEVHKYCKRNIFECPLHEGMPPTNGTKTYCIIKVQDYQVFDKNKFTAEEIQLVEAKLIQLFKLKPYALKLCTVRMGCVELVYSIPLCIYAELFPLNEDQCRNLTTVGVSEIIVNDYHYKLEHVSGIHIQCALSVHLLFHLAS